MARVPVFWLSLSIIYLLIELIFRADVIEVAAGLGDQHEIMALEHVGRFLSSLGFAIFLTSFFKTNEHHSDKQKRYRRLSMLPVFVVSYLSAVNLQEWAIDKYASETPPEFKREAMLANAYRDLMYVHRSKKDPSMEWLHSDAKVLLALTPVLVYGDPGLEDIASDASNLISKSSLAALEKNAEKSDPRVFDYHRQWIKALGWQYDDMIHLESTPAVNYQTELLYKHIVSEGWNAVRGASGRHNNSVQLIHEPSYDEYALSFSMYNRNSTNSYSSFDINNTEIFMDTLSKKLESTYVEYLGLHKKNLRYLYTHYDDETMLWFFKHNDFESLKKYYGLHLAMKDLCVIRPSKENQFIFVINKHRNIYFPQPMTEKTAKYLHSKLTGAMQKSPVMVVCDYTYERTVSQMRGLLNNLSQRTPSFNPEIAKRLVVTDADTVRRHNLFKHAAVSVMLEEGRKLRVQQNRVNKKNKIESPAITKFNDIAQYDRFVSSINFSTVETFNQSLHLATKSLSRDAFIRYTSKAGLDFSGVMQMREGTGFSNNDFFRDPKFISVFKRSMPEIFNEKGEFVAQHIPMHPSAQEIKQFLKSIHEPAKTKIRSLYADVMAGKQENILGDSLLVGKGMKYESAGENAAKGFIAAAFVLFVSNVMIAVTLISVITTLVQACFYKNHSTARGLLISCIAAACLLGPSMLFKNQYVAQNIDSNKYPALVWQAHFTANLQKTYDIILPSFIRPNWIYQIVKLSVSPREKFVQFS